MKLLSSILSAICFIQVLNAQPALNSLQVPLPVMQVSTHLADGAMPAGVGGVEQTWDFTLMPFTENTPEIESWFDPSSTDDASSFPEATIVRMSEQQDYFFYKITSTEYIELGYKNSASVKPYSNTSILFTYPFAYNSMQTDTYESSFTHNDYPVTLTGSTSVTYDGYGTLLTPQGTFENIARLKLTRTETETMHLDEDLTDVYSIEEVIYYWIYPGKITPVFTHSVLLSYHNNNSIAHQTKLIFYEEIVTSTPTKQLKELHTTLSPNPASDITTLDFKDLPAENYGLEVTDLDGQTVLKENLDIQKGDQHTLNIQFLKQGIYFVHLTSTAGKATRKFVKL